VEVIPEGGNMEVTWRIAYIIHGVAAVLFFGFGMVIGVVGHSWPNLSRKERIIYTIGLLGPVFWGLAWLIRWVVTGLPPVKV
jgi:hypothetical protein